MTSIASSRTSTTFEPVYCSQVYGDQVQWIIVSPIPISRGPDHTDLTSSAARAPSHCIVPGTSRLRKPDHGIFKMFLHGLMPRYMVIYAHCSLIVLQLSGTWVHNSPMCRLSVI
ncbi:uncharacterized protein BDW70DRAFT_144332 [Aspergillus foveolatus]|uniref:uncharacterized protein n=1 Tax=Aspergillus foveolatus TaxID=210207 RepID=UPI003CCD6C01